MYKKIFTSLVLLAFINYLFGCVITKSEKAFKEELVVGEETIEQVVFPNGDVITFDENGGEFRVVENSIKGISTEGDEIIFPLKDIRELRTEKVPSIPFNEIGDSRITEVVANGNLLFEFNDEGAKYDEQKNTLTGITEDNQTLSLAPKQILEIHTDRAKTISKKEFIQDENLFVSQIVIETSNLIVTFDQAGGTYIERMAVISGVTQEKEVVNIATSEILYVNVLRINAVGSVLASVGVVVGILAILVLIALATKESCPFVYSFDGEKYVFDAEPLGGATTRGLQRSELSKLNVLKEVDGKYKIMVKNEVEETQYLDEMSLYITDHPNDFEVITDLDGNFHTIKNPKKPIIAEDENGLDLSKFISKQDNIFWQTKLPVENYQSRNNLRHNLTFVFPKPSNEKSAKLIINAGTSLWGSNMIREMLMLYGDNVDTWYEKIDDSEIEKKQMMQFIEREELYLLKLLVKEEDNWADQGLISGGGPFISETRVYDIDLHSVKGDSLVIQLNPPYGFWTLDYIAMEYENHPGPLVKEVPLSKAIDHDENDIIQILLSTDDNYHIMPEVGDYFLAEFDAPLKSDDTDRTVFLKSTGYYEIHLPKDQPIQTQTLYEIGFVPGKIVEYSFECYEEWSKTTK